MSSSIILYSCVLLFFINYEVVQSPSIFYPQRINRSIGVEQELRFFVEQHVECIKLNCSIINVTCYPFTEPDAYELWRDNKI